MNVLIQMVVCHVSDLIVSALEMLAGVLEMNVFVMTQKPAKSVWERTVTVLERNVFAQDLIVNVLVQMTVNQKTAKVRNVKEIQIVLLISVLHLLFVSAQVV